MWLGNARGNQYSRGHVSHGPDTDQYWRFSFDEMGQYDLPAAIAYIQKQHAQDFNGGKEEKLIYVGHSMGTVMFWASFDQNAEFMSKSVSLMVGMGPVASVANMKSPIKYLALFTPQVQVC